MLFMELLLITPTGCDMNNTVRSAVIISGNNMRPDGTRHKKQINRTLLYCNI